MKELIEGFDEVHGKYPVLICSPHNLLHFRLGKEKFDDLGTGPIARNLATKYNLFSIVTTRYQEDPNWYTSSPFRKRIKEMINLYGIQVVLDLHGSVINSHDLVEIRPNLPFLRKHKIPSEFTLKKFKRDNQITIREDLERSSVCACEIELREDCRLKTVDPQKFQKATHQLSQFIADIISTIENSCGAEEN